MNKFFVTVFLVVGLLSLSAFDTRAEEASTRFFCTGKDEQTSVEAFRAALKKDAEYDDEEYFEATGFEADTLVAAGKCFELSATDVEFLSRPSCEKIGGNCILFAPAIALMPPTNKSGGIFKRGTAIVADNDGKLVESKIIPTQIAEALTNAPACARISVSETDIDIDTTNCN